MCKGENNLNHFEAVDSGVPLISDEIQKDENSMKSIVDTQTLASAQICT